MLIGLNSEETSEALRLVAEQYPNKKDGTLFIAGSKYQIFETYVEYKARRILFPCEEDEDGNYPILREGTHPSIEWVRSGDVPTTEYWHDAVVIPELTK
tara:strand:- start:205 stop:501 length:297 start_codon:yes stop_codon:yes gene_type:complete